MSDILIYNAKIIHEAGIIENGWLYAQEGKIVNFGAENIPTVSAKSYDAEGNTITAGFIDVHVHGSVGADTMDANVDGLIAMAEYFASKGVTSFTPTTLTSPHESILAALSAVKEAMSLKTKGAEIIGVHLEGPYLNAAKAGAQNPEFVRRCIPQEANQYFDTSVINLISIAPEFEENHWLIAECKRRGIQVSIAHTNASYAQAKQAIAAGLHHSTHTYNAMTGLHHREPGTLGAVLGDESVFCELIADGVHVHEGAMNLLWKAKGKDKTILITDAMRAAGLGNGTYTLGDLEVTVADGKASLADGTLAGSVLAFNDGIVNFMNATAEPFENVWQATSLNAAKSLGVADKKGSIAIGKDCDLVLFDSDVNVLMTIRAAEIIYS